MAINPRPQGSGLNNGNADLSALYELRFGNVDIHKTVEVLAQLSNGKMRQKLRLRGAVNLADKINNFSLAQFKTSKYQSVTQPIKISEHTAVFL